MPMVIAQQVNKVWSGPALARLNQQTGALLKQIEQNPGVSGAFVCDNHGGLLAARFSGMLERNVLEKAGRWLAQILAAIEWRGGRVKEVELRYDDAGFLVRDLGNAFELVACLPEVNWALLRMALNVSAPPFEKDAELQKSLARIAPTRAGTLEDEQDPDAQRCIRRMKMGGGPKVRLPSPIDMSNAVDTMARFANLLIEELAGHGLDLGDVLQIFEQRLKTLAAKYPLLKSARIANRRLNLSALEVAPADFSDLVAGWGELMREMHASSVVNLGRKSADAIFRRVHETIYEQDEQVFRNMGLELALRPIRMGGDASQLGNSA